MVGRVWLPFGLSDRMHATCVFDWRRAIRFCLRTFDQREITGPSWSLPEFDVKGISIDGPWQMEFIEGGPVRPKEFEMASLQSWTLNGDPEAERFAGTALYKTSFDAPAGNGPWLLDLGDVRHSARVRLNGVELDG